MVIVSDIILSYDKPIEIANLTMLFIRAFLIFNQQKPALYDLINFSDQSLNNTVNCNAPISLHIIHNQNTISLRLVDN